MAAKKKPLTKRQKAERAQVKKTLQEEGVLPPDKPRLNRKKFAKEVITEWKETEGPLYAYLVSAIGWMLPSEDQRRPITPEQVGALKALKIALEIKKFEDALPEGTRKYDVQELIEKAIRPVIEL